MNRNESSTSSSSRSTSISAAQSPFIVPPTQNFRSISLIDSIQFKVDGNLSKNSIVLADCDNDDKNELLVGTLNGELLIFKGSSTMPLTKAKDLGMISCIVVGDITSKNKNNIITISIEGYLNIFSVEYSVAISASLNPTLARRSSNFSAASVPLSSVKMPPTITDNEVFGCSSNCLSILHSQKIQANAMGALIADIDGDGQNELIVALSDRVVRSYRAMLYAGEVMKLVGIHKWEFSDQIGSITLSTNWETVANVNGIANGSQKSGTSESASGSNDRQERKSVLVAQHGGMFAKIDIASFEVIPNENLTLKDGDEDLIELTIGLTPEYKNISISQMRNPQISAEIISDITSNSKDQLEDSKLISVATTDGLLMLLDDDNIRWQVQLEQKIGSLCKHDIDNDGRDELVVCTWNGQTYFVNLDGQIITCLPFDQPISSFTVGHYDLNGYRLTCLVYGTFTSSVNLFYNVECCFTMDTSDNVFLDYIRGNSTLTDPLEQLARKLNEDSEANGTKFKVDARLINTILYGVVQ